MVTTYQYQVMTKNPYSDGLVDCEDPECCENPVCERSQLCHTVSAPIGEIIILLIQIRITDSNGRDILRRH